MADFDKEAAWVEQASRFADQTPEELAKVLIGLVRQDRTLIIQRGEDPEAYLQQTITAALTIWGRQQSQNALMAAIKETTRGQ